MIKSALPLSVINGETHHFKNVNTRVSTAYPPFSLLLLTATPRFRIRQRTRWQASGSKRADSLPDVSHNLYFVDNFSNDSFNDSLRLFQRLLQRLFQRLFQRLSRKAGQAGGCAKVLPCEDRKDLNQPQVENARPDVSPQNYVLFTASSTTFSTTASTTFSTTVSTTVSKSWAGRGLC